MRAVPGGTAGAVLFTFVDAARCYVDLAILILHPKTPCGPRCGVQQRPDQRFYPQRVHRPTAAVGAPCDARLLRQRELRWHYGTMHLRCFPPWPGMRIHLHQRKHLQWRRGCRRLRRMHVQCRFCWQQLPIRHHGLLQRQWGLQHWI